MKRGIVVLIFIAIFFGAWLCEELGIFAEEIRIRYKRTDAEEESEEGK